MPCQLRVGSSWHSGLVLDLSPSGLYVQTTAKTRPGQPIQLLLAAESGEGMELSVEVVRKKVVPARLLALAQGGVGVRIARAPESYYRFLAQLGVGSSPGSLEESADDPEPAAAAPPEAQPTSPGAPAAVAPETAVGAQSQAGTQAYRLRVRQVLGPRTRRLEVRAADADAARAQALRELGDGWKVLDVETL